MASDEQPTIQELCYISLNFSCHNIKSQFWSWRSNSSFDLYWIMKNFRDLLKKKSEGKFLTWRSKYLHAHLVNKFIVEALQVYTRALIYSEKKFPFDKYPYRRFTTFRLDAAKPLSHHLLTKCFKYGRYSNVFMKFHLKGGTRFSTRNLSNFVETCEIYYVNSCVKYMRAEDFQCRLKCEVWWLRGIGCPLNLWELNSAFLTQDLLLYLHRIQRSNVINKKLLSPILNTKLLAYHYH